MAVLAVILVTIAAIALEVTKAYKNTSGTIEGFRDSRAAFETMTRTISHATLNTYFDYVNSSGAFRTPSNSGTFTPAGYGRRSDLQFVTGTASTLLSTVSTQIPHPVTHAIFFFSPLGINSLPGDAQLNGTLNACGYYVMYGADPSVPSYLSNTTVPTLYRFRLMQFLEPAEYNSVYSLNPISAQWFLGPLGTSTATFAANPTASCLSQMAQNVIALIILPNLSTTDQAYSNTGINIAPNYSYDSTNSTSSTATLTFNQLPPEVSVTMVVIDEASALKLGNTVAPPNLLTGSAFTSSSQEQSDLTNLEKNLSATAGNAAGNHIPLNYRVFYTTVALSSAKWSN